MPKTDHPHALRLYQSIRKHANEETAERIAYKIPLSASASNEKKFMWALSVCTDLEKEFAGNTLKQIRMDCACGPTIGKMNQLKKLYMGAATMEAFVEKANNLHQGFTLEYTDLFLLLVYPQCYCPCVKRVDRLLPDSWCTCTLGYTKRMFTHVLEKEVRVELIESVKTGGKVCKIKIMYA